MNLFQARTQRDSASNRMAKGTVAPVAWLYVRRRPFLTGDVPRRYRPGTHMAKRHARNHLPQIAHVAGIFSMKQILTNFWIKRPAVAIRLWLLLEEIMR